MTNVALLADRVRDLPFDGVRRIVAIAGPPGSGKSTLAQDLCAELGPGAAVVPMDGFHLDNRLLDEDGLRARKGAPETFDLGGFKRLCAALREEAEVVYPLFDRTRDLAIAGAGRLTGSCTTAIVEGNYLLFDRPGWRELAELWDFSVYVEVSEPELRDRLVARWLDHGATRQAAVARAEANDIPNARAVAAARLPADMTMKEKVA